MESAKALELESMLEELKLCFSSALTLGCAGGRFKEVSRCLHSVDLVHLHLDNVFRHRLVLECDLQARVRKTANYIIRSSANELCTDETEEQNSFYNLITCTL